MHLKMEEDMSGVKRIYVEKKPGFDGKARELQDELRGYLGIKGVKRVRELIRYDVENISASVFETACRGVFAELPVDKIYLEEFPKEKEDFVFSVEFLPGQFDQRADSAMQCIQFIKKEEAPEIRTAITYVISGELNEEEKKSIENHCINPVDSRKTREEKPDTLVVKFEEPEDVRIFSGFRKMGEEEIKELYQSLGLAMTLKDFLHIQSYFQMEEDRDPTMTEIRVLDTYWSDHCRHTTFSTELTKVEFEEGDYREVLENSFHAYLSDRKEVYSGRKDKFICLMDLALMAMKKLKKEGKLADQEESEEINACSIVIPVDVNGVEEEWLLNFKNETHNHPTEIEPFGGAATCLGGAIRDPLSGRTYVYQAMRVTGAADPTQSVKATRKGKLPQKKLVREAAAGYSSYGNQIGLSTGLVKEIYHPDYVAKRMEIGAVLGAAPRRAVIRETSDPGDVIVLLGGRTGRDGCGGATGSSKVHTEDSTKECGAEVQKGNPPTERKIQRLFRREEVSKLIKKCNDFGAGGVSVAIGELADGLLVDLDQVPKKYAGLDGTEIAISESQERMAVVLDEKDVEAFLNYAKEENLEATQVAVVTEEARLVLKWRGKEIVNLSRAFLNTNGAHQETEVLVESPKKMESPFQSPKIENVMDGWKSILSNLNVCSQKGLVERFDGSIGAASVLMPHGGKYQKTETQSMVAKIPVEKGETQTVSFMSYGFDPYLSKWSPYHGAVYAVTESMAKIVATGGDVHKIRFTFQEYFQRMTEDAKKWSQPVAALLGAYAAQMAYGLPSIGGKDSMSGTFEDLHVPPTLVSFAVDVGKAGEVVTPELKQPGNGLIYLPIPKDENDLPVYAKVLELYEKVTKGMREGEILSAYALDGYGLVPALSKMAFGNGYGVSIDKGISSEILFAPAYGGLLLEVSRDLEGKWDSLGIRVGTVEEKPVFQYQGESLTLVEAQEIWEGTLEKIFPTKLEAENKEILWMEQKEKMDLYQVSSPYICKHKVAKPKVFVPVFPGTNCEYDSKKAFERAGAEVEIQVFRNLSPLAIQESIASYEKAMKQAQIVMLPGGFSAGDEPDGSAKFFATAFQNERLKECIEDLLQERDGLMLGICNGFQALIKLGLVPTGSVVGQSESSPTLTYNSIGRHVSKMVYTKVVSNKSPWLSKAVLGGVYVNPASHGEGRFVAEKQWLETLFQNGQVATQYCDVHGRITMEEEWNVNGSYCGIEGITSPDGRVFGKMAHSERRGEGIAKNIYGEQDLKIFESGVSYFQ